MSEDTSPQAHAFLHRFFAGPNRLRVGSKPELALWIDRVSNREPLPSVLPCWRPDGAVDWYGLSFNERQLRSLGESLTAFVGPSYTSFRGRLAELDTSDPIEASVAEFTGGRAYKFRGDDAKAIWAAIERMRRGWERMGPRERTAPAPVGRVLRDFHMAIRAGLEDEASRTLGLLREEYHLDGLNLLYLRVGLLASFARWDELLTLPESSDLVHLRRPVAVTESLLRAVYNQYVARFEETSDAKGALQSFRQEILPAHAPLLASRSGMHSAEVAKLFMLRAVSSSPTDVALRDELLSEGGFSAEDTRYLCLLASLDQSTAAAVASEDPLSEAEAASQRSDFDRAFALARLASDSVARTRLLCECAFELGTLEARGEAIAAVNALGEAARATFLGRRVNRKLVDDLRSHTDEGAEGNYEVENVPADWCAWIEYVDRHEGAKGAREIARRGASEWSLAEFVGTEGAVDRLALLLAGSRSQDSERALRDSLPHLLAYFQRDTGWPNVGLGGVYRLLLEILYYSTEGGRADLIVFNDLLEALLGLGAGDAGHYGELCTFAGDLWGRQAAPATLDWAIDCVATFSLHPCPDSEARRSLFREVLDRAAGFGRHVAPEQKEVLRLVARDFGEERLAAGYFPELTASETPMDDPFDYLENKTVAVYTLTEGAGRRFQEVLEARVPTVRIVVTSDRVASARLRQLARQADLFLVAAGSAKHAATECIDATRPRELPTLRPGGKGTASLLRALREHLASG